MFVCISHVKKGQTQSLRIGSMRIQLHGKIKRQQCLGMMFSGRVIGQTHTHTRTPHARLHTYGSITLIPLQDSAMTLWLFYECDEWEFNAQVLTDVRSCLPLFIHTFSEQLLHVDQWHTHNVKESHTYTHITCNTTCMHILHSMLRNKPCASYAF